MMRWRRRRKKDITVTSVEGRVEITAAEELVVNCAGAYIRLSGGNIELGCPREYSAEIGQCAENGRS